MKRVVLLLASATTLSYLACAPRPVQPRPEHAGPQAREYYGQELRSLLPALASDDLTQRRDAARRLEKLCNQASSPGAALRQQALCSAIVEYLWPDTPRAARIHLLRQLERIGGPECVPALYSLLSDADPLIREHARTALEHNPAASATDALCAALDRTSDPGWRAALINSLAARQDQAALSRLTYRAFDRNPEVSAAAISALGAFDHPDAIHTLRELLQSSDAGRAENAAAALLRIADRLTASQPQQAAELYRTVYDAAPDAATRRAALGGLAAAAPQQALPLLVQALRGQADSDLRCDAARLLCNLPDPTISATLAEEFRTAPGKVQVVILDALATRGDPAGRTVTHEALSSEDDRVRIAALQALQRLGDASDVIRLAKAAAFSSAAERDAARASLARLSGTDVDQVLLSAVQTDLDPPVRAELIRALSSRYVRSSLPILFDLAADKDPEVRRAAFGALGELGTVEDISRLVDLAAADADDASRSAAEEAIVSLCKSVEDASRRAEPLLSGLSAAAGAQRVLLVRLLGRLQSEATLAAVRAALNDPDPQVADAAVRALAGWEHPAATEDLLAIARDSPDPAHRILALQGYIRLTRADKERPAEQTFSMLQTALSLASRPEEAKLVLAALQDVPSLPSLHLARSLLTNAQLSNEAAISAANIARALAARHPDLARASLDELLATELSAPAASAVRQASDFIEAHRGYLGAWLVAGPYSLPDKGFDEVFEAPFEPEQPDQAASWQPLETGRADNPWIFNLRKLAPCNNCCFYVRTAIWSQRQQPARLEIGSDDGVVCWLNGMLVHRRLIHRAVTESEDIVPVTLQPGWNTLLLKIVNAAGGCGFCCAVRDPDGQPLPDLKCEPR
jgi:HEAT repeat protein